MTVLDLSQYDIPTFDAQCMKAAGVKGVILGVFSGASSPEGMAAVAQQCVTAGIPILGFYGLIYFGSPFGATRDTKYAIQLAKRFNVQQVWLDCEIDGNQIGFTDAVAPSPASRIAEIRECVRLVEAAGLRAGIYSGAWWWPGRTGNTTEFKHLPLWHAAYADNFGSPSEVRTVNYGGWQQVAIHQWTSTVPVCGRNRDHNHVWAATAATGDDMTPEEIETLVNRRVDAALAAQFRPLLALAINGGPGAFTDAQGVPLPLVQDQELLAEVEGLRVLLEAHADSGDDSLRQQLVHHVQELSNQLQELADQLAT